MKIVKCTNCQYEIECEPQEDGEVVECEECGCEILLTSLTPLRYEPVDQE